MCGSTVNDTLYGLYGEKLEVELCHPSYIRPITVISLIFTYGVILYKEFRRRRAVVGPATMAVNRTQVQLLENEGVYTVSGQVAADSRPYQEFIIK